jgi:hypothetical protein
MPLLIDVKSLKDKKLFTGLAKRLNLKTANISPEDLEDYSFGKLIEKGLKSKNVNKDKFMSNLRKRTASK